MDGPGRPVYVAPDDASRMTQNDIVEGQWTRDDVPRRRAAAVAVGAGAAALAFAAQANADITGEVITSSGAPVAGARVTVHDSAGRVRLTFADNHGAYRVLTSQLTGLTGPVSIGPEETDECRTTDRQVAGPRVPVADGQVVNLSIDLRAVCATGGAPEATGHVDAATGRIIAPPAARRPCGAAGAEPGGLGGRDAP